MFITEGANAQIGKAGSGASRENSVTGYKEEIVEMPKH